MEIKKVDKNFYRENIKDFLPKKIIDIHTHVWRKSDASGRFQTERAVSWPMLVANENPIEELIKTYKILLPDTEVTPLIFSNIPHDCDEFEKYNNYISEVSKKRNIPGLIFSHPEWSAEELEEKIITGNFLGVKSYLSLSNKEIPVNEITIFDFFPHHHLNILNKHGLIMMLHIPRNLRLKDPVNLKQMLEIEKKISKYKIDYCACGKSILQRGYWQRV